MTKPGLAHVHSVNISPYFASLEGEGFPPSPMATLKSPTIQVPTASKIAIASIGVIHQVSLKQRERTFEAISAEDPVVVFNSLQQFLRFWYNRRSCDEVRDAAEGDD
jgi:hypothetical protein